jgi:spore germination cell wall hydrolase CwlJ-like protein
MGDYRELEADVLARTMWGEARGEGEAGMRAVAAVVMNRVAIAKARGGYWWGSGVVGVCQRPYQFSCWNKSDANFRKILAVDATEPLFAAVLKMARDYVRGRGEDPTGGATHYHAAGIRPRWSEGHEPAVIIGRHFFYNDMEK